MQFLNIEFSDNENKEFISILCSYLFQDEIFFALNKWDKDWKVFDKDNNFIWFIKDEYQLKFQLNDLNSFSVILQKYSYTDNEIRIQKNIIINDLSDRKNSYRFISSVVLDLLNDVNQLELNNLKRKYKNTTIL
jgi:hypothetical protein